MKKFITEFKKFINKGNVVDLSVAIILGAAFSKIVNSLVKDIFTPVLSLLIGEQGFENYKYVITAANEAEGIEENAIYYGIFFQNIIDFFLIAVVVFLIVKFINKTRELAESELKDNVIIDKVADTVKEQKENMENILTDIKSILKDTMIQNQDKE